MFHPARLRKDLSQRLLRRAADIEERLAEQRLRTLVALLEPLLVVLFAAVTATREASRSGCVTIQSSRAPMSRTESSRLNPLSSVRKVFP